jgi:hypothetical protein
MNRFRTKQVALGTAPARVLEANKARKMAIIYNPASNATSYMLDSRLQVFTQGLPLPAGSALNLDHYNAQGELWGYAGSSQSVYVLEVLSR